MQNMKTYYNDSMFFNFIINFINYFNTNINIINNNINFINYIT